MLRVIGDLADRLADVLTAVALALVLVAAVLAVAALLIGTGGGAGLVGASLFGLSGSAGAATATLLGWAGVAQAVSVGAKVESKLLYHDHDLAWSQLTKDGTLAALGLAGGPMKVSKFVRNHRYFQAAAWKMGELATSGNRVAEFSIKATQFAGRWGGAYQRVHDTVLGTPENPTTLGEGLTIWKESKTLWDKHKDDPLAIFTDPIQTSPGELQKPDSVGVWVRDFGRAVGQF